MMVVLDNRTLNAKAVMEKKLIPSLLGVAILVTLAFAFVSTNPEPPAEQEREQVHVKMKPSLETAYQPLGNSED
jgi:hypothetical protein